MPRALTAFCVLLALSPPVRAGDFALRDGDKLVFLGDSITAARVYGRVVEQYTLLRYPDRKIRFHNAGIGGDTAAGGLKRLQRDVFDRGATVLTVAYGVNDIGWGLKADDAHKQAYLDGVRGIVEACKEKGVRVYICSAAVTAEDPGKSEGGYLQKMCDEGMALSKSLGGEAIDLQRSMREVQKRIATHNESVTDDTQKATLHAPDGVHLNDLGQLAMGYAILKGLGAPAEVSTATLDGREGRLIEAKGCTVSELSHDAGELRFTRLDAGLPFNFDTFYGFNYAYVPVPEGLNGYTLTVQNLEPGKYAVLADGREIGRYTAAQLHGGVNIASATTDAWHPGSPWATQGYLLRSLTDARVNTEMSATLASMFEPDGKLAAATREEYDAAIDGLIEAQRAVARPRPYKFIVRPAVEEPSK